MAKKFEITNNIRKLRFFANEMTQQELAEKANISRQTVIAIEAG
ncbi:MAG: helix-turn-helix domain-containing protein, partial [Actinomycetota bacterium]|nr:helix-turn-helix domain-containing protein [Actinomycetota bacterium]